MKNNPTEKLYYSISDLRQIIDEEQYVLRYWEREFAEIKPRKNRAGNRAYTAKDVAIILTIKNLLREDRLTIQGAKEALRNIDIHLIEDYKAPQTNTTKLEETDGSTSTKKSNKKGKFTNRENQTSDTITLRRQDVVDLCNLLKDLAVIIQYT